MSSEGSLRRPRCASERRELLMGVGIVISPMRHALQFTTVSILPLLRVFPVCCDLGDDGDNDDD